MELEYEELAVEFHPYLGLLLLAPQIPHVLFHNTALQGIFSVMIYNYRLFTVRGKPEWFSLKVEF